MKLTFWSWNKVICAVNSGRGHAINKELYEKIINNSTYVSDNPPGKRTDLKVYEIDYPEKLVGTVDEHSTTKELCNWFETYIDEIVNYNSPQMNMSFEDFFI